MNAKFAKFALIPLALVASSAFAVSVAPAATAGKHTYTATAAGTDFVANDFEFTVSANVGLESVENTTAIVVQTANVKGRNNFSGSSDGGSVAQCGTPTTGSTPPAVRAPTLGAVNGCTP